MARNNSARLLASLLTFALVALMLPPVAWSAEEHGEPPTASGTPPLRDAAYYQEYFPEVDLDAHTASTAVDAYVDSGIRMLSADTVPFYGDGYFAQELMVWTIPGIADGEVRSIIAPLIDSELLGITGNLEDGLSITVRLSSETSVAEAASLLESDARVLSVEMNSYITIDEAETISPAASFEPASSTYAHWVAGVHAPEAWEILEPRASVTVAVIDTGIDVENPVFSSGVIDGAHSFDTLTKSVGSCPDDHGHGTAVSAVISGEYASGGEFVHGISDGATILGIKAGYKDPKTGKGLIPTANQLAAYDFLAAEGATLGVRVVNMSFSGAFLGSPSHERMIDRLTAEGMVFVAAAGNNASSAGFYPAEYQNVISVSSLTQDDQLAPFSNYGAGVEIAAPGVDILVPWNGEFGHYQGTSLSSPIVAGVAALILSENPELSAQETRELLRRSTADVGEPGWDVISGSGKVDAFFAVSGLTSLRFDGVDRYDTARLIAQYGFGSVDTAIIVSGADRHFPDALSASGLAGLLDVPIIPTAPDYLPTATSEALVSLGIRTAIIVGGTPSVSSGVEAAIRALGCVQTIERLAGDDRYHTSALVYEYAESHGMSWTNPEGYERAGYASDHTWKNPGGKKTAILATGENFPDALAASSLSASAHHPILLATRTALPTPVKAILGSGAFDELIVLGDDNAISLRVAQEAATLVKPAALSSQPAKRDWYVTCAGADRFETAFLIAEQAVLEGISLDAVVIASGTSSIDASTVSTLKKPILLVHPTNENVTHYAGSFLYSHASGTKAVFAAGSIWSVSQKTFETCIAYLIGGIYG
ncbi:S8 family serine peptidase [Raoultibacter phocaeensis]|uniref:S8 family serine peptidase n=1 Tax=Raoultibacter phocaeensis TaxID=2479841 RepID=UPI001118A90D|nr:S8 family serine peptidase [Raoultibacter phocaeensis]